MDLEKLQILKQSPIFSALDEAELRELSPLAIERRYVDNETIFWEGDSAEWFYMVAEGRVKVTKLASTGKEIILSFFGPGDMFGEVAVFENKPYPASAQAISATRLMGIKRADLLEFLTKHPQVSLRIISVLSG